MSKFDMSQVDTSDLDTTEVDVDSVAEQSDPTADVAPPAGFVPDDDALEPGVELLTEPPDA